MYFWLYSQELGMWITRITSGATLIIGARTPRAQEYIDTIPGDIIDIQYAPGDIHDRKCLSFHRCISFQLQRLSSALSLHKQKRKSVSTNFLKIKSLQEDPWHTPGSRCSIHSTIRYHPSHHQPHSWPGLVATQSLHTPSSFLRLSSLITLGNRSFDRLPETE